MKQLVFLGNEQAPLLIARFATNNLVAPAAHDGVIIVVGELLLVLIFKLNLI